MIDGTQSLFPKTKFSVLVESEATKIRAKETSSQKCFSAMHACYIYQSQSCDNHLTNLIPRRSDAACKTCNLDWSVSVA